MRKGIIIDFRDNIFLDNHRLRLLWTLTEIVVFHILQSDGGLSLTFIPGCEETTRIHKGCF